MNCPFTSKPCPGHNKEGGCQLWMQVTSNTGGTSGSMEGCAFVLQPMMQMHLINNTALTVQNLTKVESEISHARAEQLQHVNSMMLQASIKQSPLQISEEQN